MTGKRIEASTTSSSGELADGREGSSETAEKWVHTGTPLPGLLRWAQSRWGNNPEKLPNRAQLLRVFREQYGHVFGVNEHTMREVRRQLAPEHLRRGGAPMHRRQPGK